MIITGCSYIVRFCTVVPCAGKLLKQAGSKEENAIHPVHFILAG